MKIVKDLLKAIVVATIILFYAWIALAGSLLDIHGDLIDQLSKVVMKQEQRIKTLESMLLNKTKK